MTSIFQLLVQLLFLIFRFFELLQKLSKFLCALLNLSFLREQTCCLLFATTTFQRTIVVDAFASKRYHTVNVVILFGQSHSIIKCIYNNNTTKQGLENIGVVLVVGNKFACNTKHALFLQNVRTINSMWFHGGYRQECCLTVIVDLEIVDEVFYIFFRLCNNVLQTATKCSFDSNTQLWLNFD